MATPAPNPDTPINIKITFDGHNRRFKLALRELGANVLPEKLRLILAIPAERQVVFERYSDSAGTFITLDSNNPSVYKQLYRAAKAKLKLRLKATVTNPTPQPAPVDEHRHAAACSSDVAMATEHLLALRYCQQQNLQAAAASQQQSMQAQQQNMQAAAAAQHQRMHIAAQECMKANAVAYQQYAEAAAATRQQNIKAFVAAQQTNSKSAIASPPAQDDDTPSPITPAAEAQVSSHRSSCSLAENSVWTQCIVEATPLSVGTLSSTGLTVGEESPVSARRNQFLAELSSLSTARQLAIRNRKNSLEQPSVAETCSAWSVYCNTCKATIPDAHYHCSICDDGDYDLCQTCVDNGKLCGGEEHWMIKRFVADGKVFNSTTETIGPKRAAEKKDVEVVDEKTGINTFTVPTEEDAVEKEEKSRTCNSCVEVYGEDNFVTCTTCDDYDLCIKCHMAQKHGHSPSHAFQPASPNVRLNVIGEALCAPGRNVSHHAVCDGCEKYIYGIRHKCLNCPDFDYCTTCVQAAVDTHPHHQFVKIYEAMPPHMITPFSIMRHHGVYCDGPLCKNKSSQSYIQGTRYKCAVCHDLDFCDNCESSPSNTHNNSHPLIKFRTAIRSVTVTTLSEKVNGEEVTLGDIVAPRKKSTSTKAKPTTAAAASTNSATPVQTVAEMKPSEPVAAEKPKPTVVVKLPTYHQVPELQAHFVRDLVADGTRFPQNHVFRQTWTLCNPGPGAWPAGCSVKYVGGDNMLCLSPSHPSSVVAVGNAAESNVLTRPVPAGSEAHFTVGMITPKREGKCISYWRLTAPDGTKFGNKLWCDVDIIANREGVPRASDEHLAPKADESGMIFPKLDKESPVSSQAELVPQPSSCAPVAADECQAQTGEDDEDDLFSEADVESIQLDDETEAGFLTDDEYDILDASDEDFLVEAQKSGASKK